MRVKATADGYFKGYRAEGTEFDVPPGTKGSWFVPVKSKPPEGDQTGENTEHGEIKTGENTEHGEIKTGESMV